MAGFIALNNSTKIKGEHDFYDIDNIKDIVTDWTVPFLTTIKI